jgi:hypothetical protein
MTNQDVFAAAEVLAKTKLEEYNDVLAFAGDPKNANTIASWIFRLRGGWDQTVEAVEVLRRYNLLSFVGVTILLVDSDRAKASLLFSLAKDISDGYRASEDDAA